MKRREARDIAFTLVFERCFREATVQDVINNAVMGRDIEVDDYAFEVASKTFDNLVVIDAHIEQYLKDWKISRLPKTTLAILRLAIGEIDYMDDIPVSVAINESVEIAKKYATEEDASYINGVLGAYVKGKSKE